MKHTIEVTLQDIANGVPNSPWDCPISCAVGKIYPNCDFGGADTMDIIVEGFTEVIDVPHQATEFARLFDAGKPVQPFTFEIEIP